MTDSELDAAVRRVLAPLPISDRTVSVLSDRHVLLFIASGLIVILLSIIAGIFISPRTLPNWAENVLISIGTAAVLKLGDCLNALIALSTGRSVDRMGAHLAQTAPITDTPQPVEVKNSADKPVPVDPAP